VGDVDDAGVDADAAPRDKPLLPPKPPNPPKAGGGVIITPDTRAADEEVEGSERKANGECSVADTEQGDE